MIYWNPNPIAFSLGPLSVHWYGILFASGFLIAYLIGKAICAKKGLPVDKLDELLFYVFIGTIIGARLAHVCFYDPSYYFSHPIEILYVWKGGLASHGGTVGALLGYYLFIRKNKEFDPVWMLDNMSCVVALVAGFIRLGNFMNSEITGKPTDGTWGIVFERINPAEPLHPVMLYESACYFLIMILLAAFMKLGLGKKRWLLFGFFITSVFGSRAFLEVFKASQADYESDLNAWIQSMIPLPFDVTVGMILSFPFVAVGIGLMIKGLKSKNAQHHP